MMTVLHVVLEGLRFAVLTVLAVFGAVSFAVGVAIVVLVVAAMFEDMGDG